VTKKKNKFKKALNLFLLLLVLFNFTFFIYKNKKIYTKKVNLKKLEENYQTSQFNPDPEKRTSIIQDEDLYAFSGYKYITTGSLDNINIEHPPLGKYIIGLSVLIFKNQNIIQLILGAIFLTLLYKLTLKTTENKTVSLATTFAFSLEKIFKEQLKLSLLDLSLGVFLLLFLLSLNKLTIKIKKDRKKEKERERKTSVLTGLFLGCIASIKYPTISLVALTAAIIFLIIKKDKNIIKKAATICLTAAIVFLLTYLPFFLRNNPLSFISLQIKALKIHLSHVPEYPKAQVFNVLIFNKWLSWWGDKDFVKTDLWSITWPILTIGFFTSFIKEKKNRLLKIWCFQYLAFLSLRLFFPRYLFLLMPFLYIILFNDLKLLLKKHLKNKN
jgi:predicted membrane-bound dolichyl-phosphate-mannose-protein mannosyltransferase